MDTIKLKKHLQIWKIAKVNLKHNFIVHFIISVVIILLTPVLFGTSDLGTAMVYDNRDRPGGRKSGI